MKFILHQEYLLEKVFKIHGEIINIAKFKTLSGTYYYHFILYALDIESISAKNKEEFEMSIKYHTIDKAEITRVYQKSKFELLLK